MRDPEADGQPVPETPEVARELAQPDIVVRVLATTIADQLTQPLTVLLGTLELWQAGHYDGEPPAALQERLEQAAADLAQRVELFTRARRYTPKRKAGFIVLDLQKAGDSGE